VEQEIAHASDNTILRTGSLPFGDIPGQSALFLDYQNDPLSLSKFYPSAVGSHTQLPERIPDVLANYRTDRNALCDPLEAINRAAGAGQKTFENIELLRRDDCVAVVTGQQAGLLTGPLYTIYKALSAVKMAECLRGRGINAVPVFWTANEDHDFQEVSNAVVVDAAGELVEARARPSNLQEGLPVGLIRLDGSIEETIDNLVDELPATEFTEKLADAIKQAWTNGVLFGDAFSRFLSAILNKYGIIIFDPLNDTLKRLAAPIYAKAVRRSSGIVSALIERDKDIAQAGYHSQVLVTEDYFPMFLHSEDGGRHSLKRTKDGTLKAKGDKREYTIEELAEMAERDPQKFSPTVVLRPVVQDYLLPTVCYFGGGAEIAYFAQNSEVYRVLERPVTPILHRQSFTVVEPKHSRTLEKYGLAFKDLFEGREDALTRIVEKYVNPELASTFTAVEEKINTELDRLARELSEADPTLAQNLVTRRRKISYHLGALRKKAYLSQTRQNETVRRRIDSLFAALLPQGHLQERVLNVTTFLNAHGPHFIDWIYYSIDLDDKGHRIIYL
jgi:bacillithiol biosynthesis cysteine-adding enzyme BshC